MLAPTALCAQSAPSTDPSAQQPAAAAPSGSVLTPDQVPNMPAFKRKQSNGDKPSPATPETTNSAPAASDRTPNDVNQAPQAAPKPDDALYNGPPPEQPLPPPPAVPQPAVVQEPDYAKVPALPPFKTSPAALVVDEDGSTYIPMDSWVYPALSRLYSLGYLDTAVLGQRPWTRRSVMHMLARTSFDLSADEDENGEAMKIYTAVRNYLQSEIERRPGTPGLLAQVDTTYTRFLGITSDPFTPTMGWELGQTLINDYGRPYAAGYNQESGLSVLAEYGRFSGYFRGEYQRAPGYYAFSPAQEGPLLQREFIGYQNFNYFGQNYIPLPPSPVIPTGPQDDASNFRVLEADISAHLAGHEISFGKHDAWLGPAEGGAFAWSNNADNIYAFQINRVEPLYIPFVSKVLGPVRYQIFYGSLQGHIYPRHPYVHSEKFSFKPTSNFEFGFQRTIIFGGNGHQSVTFGHFIHGFFSVSDTNQNTKCIAEQTGVGIPTPQDCKDPGARFTQFDFTYRLPFLRKYVTLYLDSFVHDDVTPVSAPSRAAIRPGVYISQFPFARKLDFRVEAASTDPPGASEPIGGVQTPINGGQFLYRETVMREGITNKGVIFGDPIGRQDKGGQAWLTYHLDGNQYLQFNYRNVQASQTFVAGGSTQNDWGGRAVLRLLPDLELDARVQYERWVAPQGYRPGINHDTSIAAQFTWYPKKKIQ